MNRSGKRADLVLGTAQLGLPYGAANRAGIPSEEDATALLDLAISANIRDFDTARAYGESERRLGTVLANTAGVRIVTKLDPLARIPDDAGPDEAIAAARESIATSRAMLNRARLDVVLLHRARHRTQWGGSVWRHLADEQRRGEIGALGISAQSPAEVIDALHDPLVRHIQLPFNLLDWRWQEAGVTPMLQSRPDITVHIRSAFLQGLLASDAARWPALAGLDPAAITDALDELARKTGRTGRADLCLAFVRAQDWIDGVVIGCETMAQLQANLELFRGNALTGDEVAECGRLLPRVSAGLLDPASWPA
jgi:spore coat polysaccharide biosynthesis protein SpsF